MYQGLIHLQIKEIGLLIAIFTWCTLAVKQPCLICNTRKEIGAIKIKRQLRNFKRTTFGHTSHTELETISLI